MVLKPEISFVGAITSAAELKVGVVEELRAKWTVKVGVCCDREVMIKARSFVTDQKVITRVSNFSNEGVA